MTLSSCLSPEIVTSQSSLSKEQTMERLVKNSWQRLKHTRGSYGHAHGTHLATIFATSSRDKTLKIWSIEKDTTRIRQILALPQFGSSVTAVAWTGLDHKEKSGCVAVGMEIGLIELWSVKISETEDGTTAAAALALRLEPFMCHVSAVNRLAWRPTEKSETC